MKRMWTNYYYCYFKLHTLLGRDLRLISDSSRGILGYGTVCSNALWCDAFRRSVLPSSAGWSEWVKEWESELLYNWRSVSQSVRPSWRWGPPGLMTTFCLRFRFSWSVLPVEIRVSKSLSVSSDIYICRFWFVRPSWRWGPPGLRTKFCLQFRLSWGVLPVEIRVSHVTGHSPCLCQAIYTYVGFDFLNIF
jgi:hypothetical protein